MDQSECIRSLVSENALLNLKYCAVLLLGHTPMLSNSQRHPMAKTRSKRDFISVKVGVSDI